MSTLLPPMTANDFAGVKVANCEEYVALTSAKLLSLTRRPVPPDVITSPRVEFELKKFEGTVLLFVTPAGTPSQLMSRRPEG